MPDKKKKTNTAVVAPEETLKVSEADPADPSFHQGGKIVLASEIHQGPLPSPADFKGYEDVCPGAADRILQMAEEEGVHVRKMQEIELNANISIARTGQYIGGAIAFSAIGASVFVSVYGYPWGLALALGALLPYVEKFLPGKKRQNDSQAKDRRED